MLKGIKLNTLINLVAMKSVKTVHIVGLTECYTPMEAWYDISFLKVMAQDAIFESEIIENEWWNFSMSSIVEQFKIEISEEKKELFVIVNAIKGDFQEDYFNGEE